MPSFEKTSAHALAFFFLTPLAFWSPDVLVHAIVDDFSSIHVLFLTVAMPLIALSPFVLLFPKSRRERLIHSIAGVLGIWVTGPLFMMASASFSGSGFSNEDSIVAALWLTLLFPMATFSFSTYDGSLAALGIVTVALPVFAWRISVTDHG